MGKNVTESWAAVFSDLLSEAHICHEVDYGRSVTADDSATYGTVTLIVPMVFDSVPTVAETDTGTVMLELLSELVPPPVPPGLVAAPPSLLLPPLPPPQEPMLIGRSSKQTNKIPRARRRLETPR